MENKALFKIMIVVFVILGLLVIWKAVLPVLDVVIVDFFGGLFGSFVSFMRSLF